MARTKIVRTILLVLCVGLFTSCRSMGGGGPNGGGGGGCGRCRANGGPALPGGRRAPELAQRPEGPQGVPGQEGVPGVPQVGNDGAQPNVQSGNIFGNVDDIFAGIGGSNPDAQPVVPGLNDPTTNPVLNGNGAVNGNGSTSLNPAPSVTGNSAVSQPGPASPSKVRELPGA